MIRRTLCLILFAAGVFSLSGCGSSCTSTTGSTNSCATTSATVTINLHPDTTTTVALGSTLQFTADVSGYSNTKLTWQVNGQDGGNSTVGTINSAGLYTTPNTVPNPSQVTVTAVSQANTNDVANVGVIIVSGLTMNLSPATVDLLPGKSQQFSAAVSGNSNTNVTWAVAGISGGNSTVGTINAQGLYTAPSTLSSAPQSVTITATAVVDATKTAGANVTVHNNLSVNLSPNTVALQTFGQNQFTATVAGDPNALFSWQVNGVAGGSTSVGTIAGGLYTAPNHVPTMSLGSGTNLATGGSKTVPVTVTAIYQTDSYFSASSIVSISSANQRAQNLPTPLGVSGGNANDSAGSSCCGGTLGSLVSRGGSQYILSNSHVLARTDLGAVGDSIIQPGLIDASCSLSGTSTVATLSQYVNLESSSAGSAPVDAALALVSAGKVDPSGTILQLGATTTSAGEPTDGPPHAGSGVAPGLYEPDGVTPLRVAKSGRATGLTCSSISAINVTASVTYQKGCNGGLQFQQTYTDLIVIDGGDFSAQGDSGALIVTEDTADPIGLLFASSDTASLASPVSDVLTALADPNTGEKPAFVGSANKHSVAACSLPGARSSLSSARAQQRSVPSEDLNSARRIRDAHAQELLAYPGVRAVGVAPSRDAPGEAAIVLFLKKDAASMTLPQQVDGVRIRIIEGPSERYQIGVLSPRDTQSMMDSVGTGRSAKSISGQEISRASLVQARLVRRLLGLPGVQGVGITASADNPGEAAMLVYVVRGASHDRIPPVIDGIRTAVRESSKFRRALLATPQTGCFAAAHETARPGPKE